MTGPSDAPPRIMLSGFESDTEKTYIANIIQRLNGTYVCNFENPQAYMSTCTHIVCKKPSRSEKYLAACASGKWVLTCYFIHDSSSKGTWADEKNYEWGANLSPLYPSALQMAPKRWRERMTLKRRDPPFLGWKVGLVMKDSFVQAYKRILEAGGGEAVDITSWFSADASKKAKKDHVQALLTHVFVTPKFASRISRSRADDIPYLRAEYLAILLLNEPAPAAEEYSIFKNADSGPVQEKTNEKKADPPKTTTPPIKKEKRPEKTEPAATNKAATPTQDSDVKSESPRQRESKSILGTASRLTFAHPTREKKDNVKEPVNKPLPASVFAKSSLLFKPVQGAVRSSPSAASNPQKGQTNPKSLFDVFESARAIKLPGARASSAKETNIQLRDVRVNLPKLDPTQRSKNNTAVDRVPTISLGKKRSEPEATSSKRQETADANAKSAKCHFPDDFFRRNLTVLQEFASRKKRQQTSYGILEELVNEDDEFDYFDQGRSAKPFSREVMASLEDSLEVNYRYSYFLQEVVSRMTKTIYPPHDVLYVIMKVILLDSDDSGLTNSAYRVLMKILELHPPQAPDIKAEKLYHKAFAVTNVPDADETSSFMIAVGDMLSRSKNNQDWRQWYSRDTTLGAHWTFFSRVLNLAIKPSTPCHDEMGVKVEAVSEERARNATLLTTFLTNLVVKDYHAVLVRNNYPAHSPMIKCLVADLLWPTMTGLEPWFRRPSPNLADMVALYVKAVEACVSNINAEEADDVSMESSESDTSFYDPVENSRAVLEQMSRLVAVTASWCVHCDVRDRERGKRTSKRTLEFEFDSTLRSELAGKNMDVLEMALRYLPPRLRIKVNLALIQQNCSDVLVPDSINPDEDLSLELITSRHMQMIPTVLYGEERGEENTEAGNQPRDLKEVISEPILSSAKANKRNPKGETPLHIACMANRADTVRELLRIPGIDPNATDYAGWTALGEACNHGHIDCVRAMLSLPVKKSAPTLSDYTSEEDRPPALEIDITLCPAEGQTPLHDALGNDHLEIACLLLQKGGVELLDKLDCDGRTPLDYCLTESARSKMIEYACKVAAKSRRQRKKSVEKSSSKNIMTLVPTEEYEKALPRKSVLESDDWRERVRWLCNVTWLLLSNYVTSGDIITACMRVQLESGTSNPNSPDSKSTTRIAGTAMEMGDVTEPEAIKASHATSLANGVTKADLLRYANDVTYCLRWRECWDTYTMHICRLLGGGEEATADVIADTLSPIPTDLLPNIFDGINNN